MTAKEALNRTIESLSEEEARHVMGLIGQIRQNGLTFQAAAETGEAAMTRDNFFAHKLPISPQPIALDLSEVSGDGGHMP
jgi:hypothetical protein